MKRPTDPESSPGRDRKDGLSFRQGGKKSKERPCFLSRPEEDQNGSTGFFFYSSVMPYRIKALGLWLGVTVPGVSLCASSFHFKSTLRSPGVC